MWKWIFWKPLQRLEAAAKKCSGKKKFLQCQKILKDYKSERNPLKILKGVLFWWSCRPSICNFVEKWTPLQVLFNWFVYLLRTTAYQRNLQKKSKNFETQCILCYCRCIALHFQLLQLVCLTDQWSTFYKTRMSCLSGQYILSSAINKKERETLKVKYGSSKWKVYYIVYEENIDITLWVCRCQNKLFYVMAVLPVIYLFYAFKIWFVKNSICIVSFLLVL